VYSGAEGKRFLIIFVVKGLEVNGMPVDWVPAEHK